ncbi:MAG TPA: DUF2191 domain-containing protein [Polyangia bacterium]|nr:DUF2191 domain-containing protein [Polyangia bacterium]
MRTTLTLDEDIAAKLKAESRKTGRSFRDTVNACLRAGLTLRKQGDSARPFRVKARDLGLRPGINIDKVSGLLDELEGHEHK